MAMHINACQLWIELLPCLYLAKCGQYHANCRSVGCSLLMCAHFLCESWFSCAIYILRTIVARFQWFLYRTWVIAPPIPKPSSSSRRVVFFQARGRADSLKSQPLIAFGNQPVINWLWDDVIISASPVDIGISNISLRSYWRYQYLLPGRWLHHLIPINSFPPGFAASDNQIKQALFSYPPSSARGMIGTFDWPCSKPMVARKATLSIRSVGRPNAYGGRTNNIIAGQVDNELQNI